MTMKHVASLVVRDTTSSRRTLIIVLLLLMMRRMLNASPTVHETLLLCRWRLLRVHETSRVHGSASLA